MPESTSLSPSMVLSFAAIASAFGDATRWRILGELGRGTPLMVIELARLVGRSETVVSKHMAVLQKAGAVVIGRGRMYEIPAQFRVEPGVVDFGYGRLRMLPQTV